MDSFTKQQNNALMSWHVKSNKFFNILNSRNLKYCAFRFPTIKNKKNQFKKIAIKIRTFNSENTSITTSLKLKKPAKGTIICQNGLFFSIFFLRILRLTKKNNLFHLFFSFLKNIKTTLYYSIKVLNTKEVEPFYLTKPKFAHLCFTEVTYTTILFSFAHFINKKARDNNIMRYNLHYSSTTWIRLPYIFQTKEKRSLNNLAVRLYKLRLLPGSFAMNFLNSTNINNKQNNLIKTSFKAVFLTKLKKRAVIKLRLKNKKKTKIKTDPRILYFLTILEEHLTYLLQNNATQNAEVRNLVNYYNLIRYAIKTKITRFFISNIFWGKLEHFRRLKTLNLLSFLDKKAANWQRFLLRKSLKRSPLWYLKRLQREPLTKPKLFNKTKNLNKKRRRFSIKSKLVFKKIKVVLTKESIKKKNIKLYLNTLLGNKINIYFINTLALTKFGFILSKLDTTKDNEVKSLTIKIKPSKFLNKIDRELINRYKYIGIFIKDLIRITFIALFLKKPAFLAKFIAFQIRVLPKTRKETSFIRFLIKVVKMLAAERAEILGIRLKFKGRVNRWRRSKKITGQRGIIPLHTIQNRIEYGTAQAVNRKGAIGVHIWIWYDPVFKKLLNLTYKKYFLYSKFLNN